MTKCTQVGKRVMVRTLERLTGGPIPDETAEVVAELAREDLAITGKPVPGQIYEVGVFKRTERKIAGQDLWERIA